MRYFLLGMVAIFIGGCGSKIIKVKDPNYQNSIATARGCGKTMKIAKQNAKANLSSSIVSNVSSHWESKKSTDDNDYHSSSKSISIVKSNFLVISPKFLNHTIETEYFKSDLHCIDAVLGNESLKIYKTMADGIYREIQNVAIKKNGKLDFEEKERYALKIARLYQKEILKYNKISNFINLLGAGENREMLSANSLKNMIDGKPYLDFRVDGELLYGKNLKIIPIIKDEGETKIHWQIEGRKIYKNILTTKFATPNRYRITLKGVDKNGYQSSITKILDVKNKPPIARFEMIPNKQIFTKNELVKFMSHSYDKEGSALKYQWNVGDLGYSNSKNTTIRFNKVGKFKIVLKVYDKFNQLNTARSLIRVEGLEFQKIDMGMTDVDISRVLGQPQRKINLNITSKVNSFTGLSENFISDMGLESEKTYLYDDYWLILEGKILKCMIYKKDFEKKSCKWYRKYKPYAIAK